MVDYNAWLVFPGKFKCQNFQANFKPITPEEVMELLKAATYDKVIDGYGQASEVISDGDLQRLLDRSDLQGLWQRRLAEQNGETHFDSFITSLAFPIIWCLWNGLEYISSTLSCPIDPTRLTPHFPYLLHNVSLLCLLAEHIQFSDSKFHFYNVELCWNILAMPERFVVTENLRFANHETRQDDIEGVGLSGVLLDCVNAAFSARSWGCSTSIRIWRPSMGC